MAFCNSNYIVRAYAIVVVAQFESVKAAALERSHGVQASAVVAHVRVSATLVHVHASISGRRECISVMTNTLKTSVQIGALAVPADPFPLVALVDVLGHQIEWSKTRVNNT